MKNNWYRSRSLFVQPPIPKRPRKKWRIRYVIWSAIKRTCMVIGAFVLITSLIGMLSSAALMKEGTKLVLPDKMVLTLPLEKGLVEHKDQIAGYGFQDKTMTVRDVVTALDRAAKDRRVKGFVLRIKGGQMGLTHIEEVRAAIARFRETGKFAYIYSESYERLSTYFLASAFEQIWMQPTGVVSIAGIDAQMPYARDLLDKIGIEPQFFHRKEYKNLFESMTNSKMSDASRESMTAMVDSIGETLLTRTAASREMSPEDFKALVNKGLYTSDQAYDAKLIDRLDYIDAFNKEIKKTVTGDPDSEADIFASIPTYLKDRGVSENLIPVGAKKPKVALIYAVGKIVQFDDGRDPLGAADNLIDNIDDAADDPSIGVIVLRIDSPGGDPTAAESIRHALEQAKKKGKKIVVSMGDAAASGGYWIATPADYIFAEPTTLTGSIGVAGGKVSLKDLWGKIGVNWDGVNWGDNASLWSMNEPYSASERARMDDLMDSIYDKFVSLVADSRHMSFEQADKVARGRVWTGAQAKDVGLVDQLGGLDDTMTYVAGLVGALDRQHLNVVVMPRPRSAIERVVEFFETQASMNEFFKVHAHLFNNLSAMINDLNAYASGRILVQ